MTSAKKDFDELISCESRQEAFEVDFKDGIKQGVENWAKNNMPDDERFKFD